jgi:hypothetical protein
MKGTSQHPSLTPYYNPSFLQLNTVQKALDYLLSNPGFSGPVQNVTMTISSSSSVEG